MGAHGACCGHLWCWECCGDWADHVNKHGGWYVCNIAKNATGALAQQIKDAAVGSEDLKTYTDCAKVYDQNTLSEKAAFKSLEV